jgi:hypothetical protein
MRCVTKSACAVITKGCRQRCIYLSHAKAVAALEVLQEGKNTA